MRQRSLWPPSCSTRTSEGLSSIKILQVSFQIRIILILSELKITEISIAIGKEWRGLTEDDQNVRFSLSSDLKGLEEEGPTRKVGVWAEAVQLHEREGGQRSIRRAQKRRCWEKEHPSEATVSSTRLNQLGKKRLWKNLRRLRRTTALKRRKEAWWTHWPERKEREETVLVRWAQARTTRRPP